MSKTTMGVEMVPANLLQRHPANPRQGNVEAIKESIARNGWHGVVVAQRSSGHILAGNHRWEAAADIFGNGYTDKATGEVLVEPGSVPGLDVATKGPHKGMLLVPTHYRDVDDDTALRILLADNRTGDLATYDEPQLLQLLLQIEQGGELAGVSPDEALAGTGYTAADAEQLQMGLEVAPVEPWNNTPEHNMERYLATDLRQITVIMESAEYGPVIDAMQAVLKREEMETNKDVFLHLLKLDPAGADLEERIAAARSAAEAATANGDGPSANEDDAGDSDSTDESEEA